MSTKLWLKEITAVTDAEIVISEILHDVESNIIRMVRQVRKHISEMDKKEMRELLVAANSAKKHGTGTRKLAAKIMVATIDGVLRKSGDNPDESTNNDESTDDTDKDEKDQSKDTSEDEDRAEDTEDVSDSEDAEEGEDTEDTDSESDDRDKSEDDDTDSMSDTEDDTSDDGDDSDNESKDDGDTSEDEDGGTSDDETSEDEDEEEEDEEEDEEPDPELTDEEIEMFKGINIDEDILQAKGITNLLAKAGLDGTYIFPNAAVAIGALKEVIGTYLRYEIVAGADDPFPGPFGHEMVKLSSSMGLAYAWKWCELTDTAYTGSGIMVHASVSNLVPNVATKI